MPCRRSSCDERHGPAPCPAWTSRPPHHGSGSRADWRHAPMTAAAIRRPWARRRPASAATAVGRALPRDLRDWWAPITGGACAALEAATVRQIRDRLVTAGPGHRRRDRPAPRQRRGRPARPRHRTDDLGVGPQTRWVFAHQARLGGIPDVRVARGCEHHRCLSHLGHGHGEGKMSKLRMAAALTAVVLVASCAKGADDPAGRTPPAATPSTGSHAGHFSAPPAAPLRAGERFATLTMPRAVHAGGARTAAPTSTAASWSTRS